MNIVIMDILTFKNIIRRFLQGTASKEDEKILENFENQMIKKSSKSISFSDETKEQIYQNVSTEIFNRAETPFNWKRWAVVASFFILLGSGFLYFILNDDMAKKEQSLEYITITTQKNEKREILLEDGTQITLYDKSSLIFPKKFSANIRSVSLSGEAFFEVTKNQQKPFIVISENIQTQVFGTSFNVEAYQKQKNIKITLTSGKIAVQSSDSQQILSPGEQLIYDKSSKKMISKKIDLEDFLDMKNGILRFDSATLSEVAEKLEEFYNIKISLNLQNENLCQVTGVFHKEELDVVLRQIAFVHQGIIFEKVSNEHIIVKGICN